MLVALRLAALITIVLTGACGGPSDADPVAPGPGPDPGPDEES